jgi:enoyl-CoA hydratase/carnithine racemase
MSEESVVLSMKREDYFEIIINRPAKLNALTWEVYEKLGAAVDDFAQSDSRVAVIRGAGGRAFVAGADIDQYVDMSEAKFSEFIQFGCNEMRKIMTTPKPLIAAIQGYALGGGLELALHCDLIVATPNSKFGLPEALLGLLPGGGGTQLLPRLIGRVKANELIMRGRWLSGKEALDCGLLSALIEEENFESDLLKYVQEVNKRAPLAHGILKKLVYDGLELGLDDALQLELTRTAPLIESKDGREGVRAFIDKRPPKFNGN